MDLINENRCSEIRDKKCAFRLILCSLLIKQAMAHSHSHINCVCEASSFACWCCVLHFIVVIIILISLISLAHSFLLNLFSFFLCCSNSFYSILIYGAYSLWASRSNVSWFSWSGASRRRHKKIQKKYNTRNNKILELYVGCLGYKRTCSLLLLV